jgi:transcriptional regulator with XRE-family HTH domain
MQIEKAFGEVLKDNRKRVDLTQEALALECGIDRTYISSMERGRRSPTLRIIFKLSHTLQIPASEMIAQIENIFSQEQS